MLVVYKRNLHGDVRTYEEEEMKTQREQIEEMAKITDTAKKPCDCLCVSECIKHHPNCTFRNRNEWSCIGNVRAESIYSAGYRKASDVIDDFVERIMTDADAFLSNMSRNIIRICASKMKKEISYEMRREVE